MSTDVEEDRALFDHVVRGAPSGKDPGWFVPAWVKNNWKVFNSYTREKQK